MAGLFKIYPVISLCFLRHIAYYNISLLIRNSTFKLNFIWLYLFPSLLTLSSKVLHLVTETSYSAPEMRFCHS